MQSSATSPNDYIAELPTDRRLAIEKLRNTINKTIDPKFSEEMGYGMIGWVVPKSIYPAGYHVDPKQPLPFLGLASQKNHIALYHMGIYSDPELLKWFQDEYAKTGFKLDIGKSCIRFKKLDQIPYELIAELISKVSLNEFLKKYTGALK
jgi:uncharacterized protein YdhG (YjbR/CyaY superfamily)